MRHASMGKAYALDGEGLHAEKRRRSKLGCGGVELRHRRSVRYRGNVHVQVAGSQRRRVPMPKIHRYPRTHLRDSSISENEPSISARRYRSLSAPRYRRSCSSTSIFLRRMMTRIPPGLLQLLLGAGHGLPCTQLMRFEHLDAPPRPSLLELAADASSAARHVSARHGRRPPHRRGRRPTRLSVIGRAAAADG